MIGTPVGGTGASLQMAVLLFLNVFLQVLFVGIMVSSSSGMTTPTITTDTVTEYRAWRINVAHDVKHSGRGSSSSTLSTNQAQREGATKSLARRVCDGEAGLEIGTEESSQYGSLVQYVAEKEEKEEK